MDDVVPVLLRVNGDDVRLHVPPTRTLLDVVREDLDLCGTKHGCDVGECGACTVLLDGTPRLSCLTLVGTVEGREVCTIEGIATPAGLHPIQEAFDRRVAAQCGYCTPGIVLTLVALRARMPDASPGHIRDALGSNLCRCTGWGAILRAAEDVFAPCRGGTA
ncbi:MAG: Carbon-monoxide dehydrogenase (acceptor),(2Fe-2S)-binding protein [Pseudomonadota bacterium]|jgi:carbon-monoxide dehydrogenase small subunit